MAGQLNALTAMELAERIPGALTHRRT
jgi:hypothetical protein